MNADRKLGWATVALLAIAISAFVFGLASVVEESFHEAGYAYGAFRYQPH